MRISQEDFAEACGVHRNYIGRIERAEINPTFESMERIARALGMRPSELLAKSGN